MRTCWVPVCKWCGKCEKWLMSGKEGSAPPLQTPKEAYGHQLSTFGCDESPNRREHSYVWRRCD